MATKAEFVASETGLSVQEIKDALVKCDAKTVEEAHAAYDAAPKNSPQEAAVIERWGELSLQELENATTYEEVLGVYNDAPGGGTVASRKAFEKWISLCTTVRQAMAAYFVTSSEKENSEVRRMAIRKIYDLHVHSSDVGEPPSNPNEGPM